MIKLNRLIDKFIILILGLTASALLRISIIAAVAGVLISIIIMSLSQCVGNKKILFILHGCFALSCLIFPSMFLFLPVGVYDMIYEKNKYVKTAFLLFPLLSMAEGVSYQGVVIIVVSIISVILAYRGQQNEQLTEKLICMRDSSEENKLLLYERNRYLSKSKDDEISLAIMAERNRIAREIHDNVGHMLSRTILQMGAVCIINKDENIKPHLEEINNSLNGAMTSMRESVHNLHDDTISLKKSIDEIVATLSEKFTVKYDFDASENAGKDIKLCIIGIVKEAVSNIIRHSSGSNASVIIREHPAFFQITVDDNGCNNEKINESGMGIENMKLRAEQAKGIFKVTSGKNGFKIFTSIPKEGYKP